MATRAINTNVGSEVRENKGSTWRPFTELLATVGEVASMYFGSPGSITSLDADHRSNLSAKGKTDNDVDLMGLR
ncbi:MAG: hypothetical protein QF898_11000 [SAR202 cluster bacterium]|jgi:hypothetical protein|nr:hypothetical protein [SAR202 cluster bacterium]MDP6513913.1 hypothetical protein [SAR202 cluster bacterium]MDP6714219.1 hypothetical protein [SAR202 cluster bacterium]|tara:strand:- start:54 stop:275 length:222 start_codon:yes stop_codon:yes gene_type:complete